MNDISWIRALAVAGVVFAATAPVVGQAVRGLSSEALRAVRKGWSRHAAAPRAPGETGRAESVARPRAERYESREFSLLREAVSALAEVKTGFQRAGLIVTDSGVFKREAFPWRYYFVIEFMRAVGDAGPYQPSPEEE